MPITQHPPRSLAPSESGSPDDLVDHCVWHDIESLGIQGRGFDDVATPYDRLPSRAQRFVRPAVWEFSTHSAGLHVRFMSDATSIMARWTLRYEPLSSPHMTATGASGLDLYVKSDGAWRWLAVAKPDHFPCNQFAMIDPTSPMKPGMKEFLLYLPLYNGVMQVELGVPKQSIVKRAIASHAKPICCYGTSIVQGDSASRPGMAYPSMLGRWFDRPVINLGFSGQGRAEPEIATLLAELDPAVYVIDALPNLVHEQVESRISVFVETLRHTHSATPIFLVESITYQDSHLIPERFDRMAQSNIALKTLYQRLQSAGVSNLHYVEGVNLLGQDGEGTVDGTHPTDLGISRLACAIAAALKPVLASAE